VRFGGYKLESRVLENALRRSFRQRKYLEQLGRDLRDTLQTGKQSLEILEEDHGKAIRLFTVVTIIFLPLTFVATVLGMNTSDIRNLQKTQTLYWEIALPLTAIVILVAYAFSNRAGDIQEYWYGLQRRSRLKKSVFHMDLPAIDELAEENIERVARSSTFGISRNPGLKLQRAMTWSVLTSTHRRDTHKTTDSPFL
jgi:hypothetical protein